MVEDEVTITINNATLSGTLCLPEKHGVFPVVIMVHGSGNLDRNENTGGQKLDVFNTFARHLSDSGVASLRYDKRGVGRSTGNYYTAGHFDLVNDAMEWLEYISTNEHCDKNAIFLLGHSEGSIIVPQLSQRSAKIAGIIMIAPFIEKMESILIRQARNIRHMANDLVGLKNLPIKILFKIFDPVKSQIKLINKINRTSKDVIYSMFQKIPARWLKQLLSINPADIYKMTTCSSLVIGGAKDIQCNPDDVAEISKIIQGPVESHLISDMSHILRLEAGKPSIFNYSDLLKKPIEPQVLNLVNNWIQKEVSTISRSQVIE